METLVEYAQGSVGNQNAIFNAQVVDDINFIFRNPSFSRCSEYKVAHSCPIKSSHGIDSDAL
jgi:hypothetical protein